MDMIEEFFKKKLITNKNTQRSYANAVQHYFKTINKDMNTYFHNGHDIEKDITDYYLALNGQYTPTSIKNIVNAVKQFLVTFDKNIKTYDIWDTISLRLRGVEAPNEDMPLDKEDIKKILHYGDIQAKAMFTIMASSGCRIESIVGILPSDIHDDETPTRIVFRPEIVKGKKHKVTSFITQEATEYYHAWMRVRQEWLDTACKKSTFYNKDANDKRVFPMTDVNARLIWRGMCEKAGYDARNPKNIGHRLKAHPHSLRKFLRSHLGNSDLAEHLMGHKGYLSQYRQYTDKQLGKEYMKYMQNLTIFTKESKDVKEVKDQVTKLQEENAELKNDIADLDRELRKLIIKELRRDDKEKK